MDSFTRLLKMLLVFSQMKNSHSFSNIWNHNIYKRITKRFITSFGNSNNHIDNFTKVKFIESKHKINYDSNLLFIGSCFSESMSAELKNYKFNVYSNPQGIVFNPISISQCLNNIMNQKIFDQNDLFIDMNNSDIIHSWQHHSSFSQLLRHQDQMLSHMNDEIQKSHNMFMKADFLYLTLGTSFVHELMKCPSLSSSSSLSSSLSSSSSSSSSSSLSSSSVTRVVSNCHKQPSFLFKKRLLSVEEIVSTLRHSIIQAKAMNPKLQVILTVSPVRHTREGVIENSRSKAHLLTAVHTLIEDDDDDDDDDIIITTTTNSSFINANGDHNNSSNSSNNHDNTNNRHMNMEKKKKKKMNGIINPQKKDGKSKKGSLKEFVTYFPAYEYVIDELRDYRYYAEDLIHPSATTITHIFEKFISTYINHHDNITLSTMNELANLYRNINHRPSPSLARSGAYIAHIRRTLEKAEKLQCLWELRNSSSSGYESNYSDDNSNSSSSHNNSSRSREEMMIEKKEDDDHSMNLNRNPSSSSSSSISIGLAKEIHQLRDTLHTLLQGED